MKTATCKHCGKEFTGNYAKNKLNAHLLNSKCTKKNNESRCNDNDLQENEIVDISTKKQEKECYWDFLNPKDRWEREAIDRGFKEILRNSPYYELRG